MSKITFVACLYLFGLCGLLIGGHDLYLRACYALDGEVGVMKSDDPELARTAKYAPGSTMYANVYFETASGTPIRVERMYIRAVHLKRLGDGQGIPARFLRSDPHTVLYEHEELPADYWWLLIGVIATALGIWSHVKLRREAREAD